MKLIEELEVYRGWDESYQQSDGCLWGANPSPLMEYVLRSQDFDKNMLVADLGAGDGRNTAFLAQNGYNALCCVDISRTGLNTIRERAEASGFRTPILIHSPLEDVAIGDKCIDGAVCVDTLPQIRHPQKALEEIARILKPGASLFINFFTDRDCAFGEGEMVGSRSYLYKGTLFNFFTSEDCHRLFRGLFEIRSETEREWIDPPHYPFRPVEHRHVALDFCLRKI